MYPNPYLNENQVKVYYRRDNIKDYIMDVDGSIISEVRIPSEYFDKDKKGDKEER